MNFYTLILCRIRTVIDETVSKEDYLEIRATLMNICLGAKELLFSSSVL